MSLRSFAGHGEQGAGAPNGDSAADERVEPVRESASAYVVAFEHALSSLVVEERYVQIIKLWLGASPQPYGAPELVWEEPGHDASAPHSSGLLRRRQLLSDVLLVQPPGQMWIGYRDVAEVDGRAVRDRAVRVERLFLSGTAADHRQIQRIADESARYNLGAARNINMPTFPLQLLRPGNVPRFSWKTNGTAAVPGAPAPCTRLTFRETGRPTMVKTDSGRHVPLTGEFCVDAETGRVWRARLDFRQRFEDVQGAFEVTFRPAGEGDVLVPATVWEWALSRAAECAGRPCYVEGAATYTNVRRFGVTTSERPR